MLVISFGFSQATMRSPHPPGASTVRSNSFDITANRKLTFGFSLVFCVFAHFPIRLCDAKSLDERLPIFGMRIANEV